MARRRLARSASREALRQRAWIPLLAALAAAATRPLVWPLAGDDPLWAGAPRAALFFAAALAVGLAVVRLVGGRRPSPLAAARRLDEALGLRGVVACGHALEKEGLEAPMAALAVARARGAVADLDVARALPLASPLPNRRWLAALLPCLVLASALGAYDPALVSALVAPPTDRELDAADRLAATASELERAEEARASAEVDRPAPEKRARPEASSRDRERAELAARARDAARAARRGDRAAALRALDELGRAGRERGREAEELRRALRQMADALERTGALDRARRGERGAGRGETAGADEARDGTEGAEGAEGRADAGRRGLSEELSELARQVGSRGSEAGDAAESRRAIEALAAAAADAARRGEGSAAEGAGQMAEALARASEALGRGDREAAARALEEASARAAAMSEARAEAARAAEAVARLMEASGALERAVQLALARQNGSPCDGSAGCDEAAMGMPGGGEEGASGEGEGQGADALARALARRLAALGAPESEVGPGAGGHIPDRGGARRGSLEARGDVRAPSQVREGARAVKAIQGLGRSEEPATAYGEVYPSYAAMAEESVQDESIPAARRETVRRYFESIRPGGSPSSAE